MTATMVVSQLGARMHYAVPRILHQSGELERLYTDACATKGWPRLLRHLPSRWQPRALRRLAGRIPVGIPPDRLTCFGGLGLSYAFSRARARSLADETKAALDAAHRFSDLVVRHGFGRATGFYGIAGECREQIQAARAAGLWTAVEQIIAPRAVIDRLVREEEERFPHWPQTIGEDRYSEAFGNREKAEWAAADAIICPSEFVRRTVVESGGPADRCVIVPYGVDARFRAPERARHHGPLRILTVGAVGLRKGSPYVMEAARQMAGRAVFRMIGACSLPPALWQSAGTAVEILGAVPRAEVMQHYAWADVFLLPSICEGSATVVYEALAAGLPVITTPNTGSVVRHGMDGFIVPIRDVQAIVQGVETLRQAPDLLADMSASAVRRAAEYDLAGYGRRLRAVLRPQTPLTMSGAAG